MRPPKSVGLPAWNRIAFIFLGIFILLWLPVEENSIALVLLISGWVCMLGLLGALNWHQQQQISTGLKRKSVWYPLAGMLAGLAVTLVAMALMAIKTGLHGHGAPDYLPAQVSLVLRLTPLWAGLGLIFGGLAAAWRR